jgi:hypothetical protein
MKWKEIPDWPVYEVSDTGRVRRKLIGLRGSPAVERIPYITTNGYPYISLRQPGDKKGRAIAVSRLVLMAFVGLPPTEDHQAAHGDGDPLNNNLSNLRWATHSENQMDRVRHGTSNRGARQHMSKLTADDILAIRRRLAAGHTQRSIADDHGIARTTVSSIAIGKSWFWL